MVGQILDHLADLVDRLRTLELDPCSVQVDRNLIQVTLANRTEGQALAEAYRAPLMQLNAGNMHRFGAHRRYIAEPRRLPLLIHAVSFPHHDDWVPIGQGSNGA